MREYRLNLSSYGISQEEREEMLRTLREIGRISTI